jgi:hypothetical protein
MAKSASEEEEIHRYLRHTTEAFRRRFARDRTDTEEQPVRSPRYNTDTENVVDYWDEEIEIANKILHGRVIRMHRDRLCTGCARFDWLRTIYYTRETRRRG